MKTQLFLSFEDISLMLAAGIIKEVTLVLTPSPLHYAMYVDTMWPQAGR